MVRDVLLCAVELKEVSLGAQSRQMADQMADVREILLWVRSLS